MSIMTLGADKDFWIVDGVLKAYLGIGGEVIIPDKVTTIEGASFANMSRINSIVFGEELTLFSGYSTFYGCTGI